MRQHEGDERGVEGGEFSTTQHSPLTGTKQQEKDFSDKQEHS